MEKIKKMKITEEFLRGTLLEKQKYPGIECVVCAPGLREGEFSYFDRVIDGGPNAECSWGSCLKDHAYVDYACERQFEYYRIPPGKRTVTMFHSHPEGVNHFSCGDRVANLELARIYGGCVVGLFWVDPEFHMKAWYVDENGQESPVEIILDEEAVKKAMPKKNILELRREVEEQEHPEYIRPQYEQHQLKSAASLFRFPKKKDVKLVAVHDLLDTFPEFRDELAEIGLERKVYIDVVPDGSIMVQTEDMAGEKLYVKVQVEMEGLTLISKGRKGSYKNGVIKAMVEKGMLPTSFKESKKRNMVYNVFLPKEYRENSYVGPLYGYYHEEARAFNVVPKEYHEKKGDIRFLGYIRGMDAVDTYDLEGDSPYICANWYQGETEIELHVAINDFPNPVRVDFYSFEEEAFSRNAKVAEHNQMRKKQAIVVGCGSGGSYIVDRLVRAGIGSIVLCDSDIFQYHNLSRHMGSIQNIGKFKVDLMAEHILEINPYCQVYTFRDELQKIDPTRLKEIIWKDSIILGCADNRHVSYICQELADEYEIPFIDAGCGPRASTGEIFFYKPNCGMACYTCAMGEDVGVDYSNQQVTRKYYATEEHLAKLQFQPGMAVDIDQVSILATKLTIDLLMEKEEGYEPKLLPYLGQGMIIVNYPTDEEINPIMKVFQDEESREILPLQWLSVDGQRKSECSYCGHKVDKEDTEIWRNTKL